MALRAAEDRDGLTRYDEYQSRKRERALNVTDPDDDRDEPLTEEQEAELEIARYCLRLMDDGVEARRPFETFDEAWDTFIGAIWPAKYPNWKSRITINKIRSYILFIQAVMTDNKPRVQIEPLIPGSEDAAEILRKLVDRDWDETGMQEKIALGVLYGLIFGTGFMKVWYDPRGDGGRGKHMAQPIAPYRLYMNRTATSIEDAEYVIHTDDQTMGWIRRNYPDKAAIVEEFRGARLSSAKSRAERDLVREGTLGSERTLENPLRTKKDYITDPQATRVKGGGELDTVEVAEFWFRDDEMETYSRQVILDGVPQMTDALDDYDLPILEEVGSQIVVSPLDGLPVMVPTYRTKQVPKMELAEREKFPNGRLVVMAGPVVLADVPNPYQIDGFPFAEWKAVDFGPVWGQGIALVLKDLGMAVSRIVSQAYDIMEKAGNPSWKYKKGSGLKPDTLKNKPGSLIPLDELDSLQQVPGVNLPNGFGEVTNMLKQFMGEVAAIQDSVMGALQGGNVAFATIDQLQESGAAPIRAMVRNLEKMLKRIGTIRVQLIQQFDKGDRPLRERIESEPRAITDPETGEVVDVVPPAAQVTTRFRTYSAADIQGLVEYAVIPDSSLSTSPAGKWTRYMQLYEKHLIDRQAFHEAFKIDGYRALLDRMAKADAAAAQAKQKPGPKPSAPPRAGKRPHNQPRSGAPNRMQINAVR